LHPQWGFMSCQASSKWFFSSSMLCSYDWCTRCWMSPHILQSTGLRSVLFGSHRLWGMKAGSVDCSRNHTVLRARCAVVLLVLLKYEDITWHVAHHGQQLLWQEHVTVVAAGVLHSRTDKDEICESKPWDADGHHDRLTKRRIGAQLVANLSFDFPQVAPGLF